MTRIKEVTNYLEQIAPLSSQEDYDNCGLLVGNPEEAISNILVTLDCTEEVVEEAISNGCNLIIAHHPIIFKGLKKLNGKNYVERTVLKAIKNNVAIYALHTALDNSFVGVNAEFAKRLDLINASILQPKEGVLYKLTVYVPKTHVEQVKEALFEAGAGNIGNYSECSFISEGTGTFKPLENSQPFIGQHDAREAVEEMKLEVLVSTHLLSKTINKMLEVHPYEEVAYDIYPIKNKNKFEGAGMIGELKVTLEEVEFFKRLKEIFGTGCIRHTKLLGKPIHRVAVCGGSGSFLIKTALQHNADVYVTADVKYHEFFDAEDRMIIADIGHFESEKFTIELFIAYLKEKFSNFAILKSGINTNPVNYF